MNLTLIIEALNKSWDAISSYSAVEWSKDNRARGQCAVSSLIVQDYLGGDIVRFEVEFNGKIEKHYANLVSSTLIDTTNSQFPEAAVFRLSPPKLEHFVTVRDRLLGDLDTRERYKYLKDKVKVCLASTS